MKSGRIHECRFIANVARNKPAEEWQLMACSWRELVPKSVLSFLRGGCCRRRHRPTRTSQPAHDNWQLSLPLQSGTATRRDECVGGRLLSWQVCAAGMMKPFLPRPSSSSRMRAVLLWSVMRMCDPVDMLPVAVKADLCLRSSKHGLAAL